MYILMVWEQSVTLLKKEKIYIRLYRRDVLYSICTHWKFSCLHFTMCSICMSVPEREREKEREEMPVYPLGITPWILHACLYVNVICFELFASFSTARKKKKNERKKNKRRIWKTDLSSKQNKGRKKESKRIRRRNLNRLIPPKKNN